MLKCIFRLLKPRLDISDCVYGRIVILKNCIIVRKQHLDHRMHLATQNGHIVTGSNSTIQRNYRTTKRKLVPRSHNPYLKMQFNIVLTPTLEYFKRSIHFSFSD